MPHFLTKVYTPTKRPPRDPAEHAPLKRTCFMVGHADALTASVCGELSAGHIAAMMRQGRGWRTCNDRVGILERRAVDSVIGADHQRQVHRPVPQLRVHLQINMHELSFLPNGVAVMPERGMLQLRAQNSGGAW